MQKSTRVMRLYGCLITVFLLCALTAQAAVPDYTIAYGYRFGSEWQNNYISPFGAGIYPGIISSGTTPRDVYSPHTGVDFNVKTGTPVVAIGGGTVTQSGWGGSEPGNWVWLHLGGGLYAVYMHLDSVRFDVSNGPVVVAKGEKIGETGNTGASGGPHLHFTFRTGDNDLNDNTWWYLRSANTGWNSAKDLDMFKAWYHNSGGRFNITVYTMDVDIAPYTPVPPDSVAVFHRKAGETAWRSSPMVKGTNFEYYWDFSLDPNYRSGDQIQAVVRGQASRLNKTDQEYKFQDGYPWAFAPGRYKKPDSNPNNWLGGGPTQWFLLYR